MIPFQEGKEGKGDKRMNIYFHSSILVIVHKEEEEWRKRVHNEMKLSKDGRSKVRMKEVKWKKVKDGTLEPRSITIP